MKTKILTLACNLLLIFTWVGCQEPEEFHPNIERNGITNLTARFIDDDRDENNFTSEIDYQNKVITVVFPYNYPRLSDNVLDMSSLKKMRVFASLENNVYVTPKLYFMDLTKENTITVTDQNGGKADYKVVAEIRKSNECAITKFDLPNANLSGLVKEADKVISLVSADEIGKQLATVSISHGASISPDPTIVALDYDQEQQFKVTAQDGVTSMVYTVKKEIPQKINNGLRASSAQLLWVKKLVDIGLTQNHMTTGIAALNNYVVVNERGNGQALYLNAKTGEIAGHIDISEFAGSLTNMYATADDNDNILFCNFNNQRDGKFIIWRVKGVKGKPEKYLEYTTSAQMGRKLSVIGSLDGEAIITAPIHGTAGQFARWQVKAGKLVSTTPVMVQAQGLGNWGNNADVIYSNPADPTSDYFAAYYAAPRHASMFDGKTNSIKAKGPEISSNWLQNAVDYTVFNKAHYFISNSVNLWTWGTDDCIYLFDTGGGNLDTQVLDFSSKGLDINGKYGGKALGKQNANGTGDVALRVSNDGYYLYIYFMFTNGYVGCVRCDCLDL